MQHRQAGLQRRDRSPDDFGDLAHRVLPDRLVAFGCRDSAILGDVLGLAELEAAKRPVKSSPRATDEPQRGVDSGCAAQRTTICSLARRIQTAPAGTKSP